MEDRHVIAKELNGIEGAHLVGVFDGHRGAECAEFAHHNIAEAGRRKLTQVDPG